ncbi:phage adaptor protein [Roseicitreum antarcticum]|uniref:Uncharacterized protein n=1 Tax=Roseicitreum antarcticum TaxID=564137 RepID=A0A1H3E6P7_9RHOB|nr:DUF6682 family protein [Roseicitreum antarcticum]SDX73928.1 hypothetical protein SAMN04488238_11817 [Roseicitreum antarcticum]
MAFQARDVMRRATIMLQDGGGVRWPAPELCDWLDDGAREIALQKPTATASTAVLELVEGTKQSLPEGYHKLLAVVRNVAGRVVTPAVREVFDTQIPGWHDTAVLPFSATVMHVVDDMFDQSVFYVVPGNTGTGEVEAIVSRLPEKITRPSGGSSILDLDSYTAAVAVPDIYQNALVDYVCYRAFSKDINVAGAAQRAQAHYQLFQQALGIKSQVEMAQNVDTPKSRFSQ